MLVTAKHLVWDDDEILSSIGMLERVLKSSYGPGVFRRELIELRDNLHEVCVEFEANGDAERFDECYMAHFDALSHLTEAIRGKGVRPALLRQTVIYLRKALLKGGGA